MPERPPGWARRYVPGMDLPITFRALAEADLPLFHEWLTRPHVAEWWDGVPTLAEVRDEYLPLLGPGDVPPLDAPAGVVFFLVCEGGVPVGFAQAYRVTAHHSEGWWLAETDPCALGADQFLADAHRLGQGLGTRMLRAFLGYLFADPRVTSVQVDPAPENTRAIAAYRKSGFHEIGIVETPDGPAVLMRASRP